LVGFLLFTTLVVLVDQHFRVFLLLKQKTKLMWIETVAYMITFIISAGCAVLGIMLTYQLYQIHQKPVFQILLFQQIFLMSFYIYGIWGNMAFKQIISELNTNSVITAKLAILVPVIGVPFLLVSWFMLIRLGYVLNGYQVIKGFVTIFFSTLITAVFAFFLLIQKEVILVPGNPDLFIVRILVILNLIIQILFTAAFVFPKKYAPVLKEIGLSKKWAFAFFGGTIIYSLALFYFDLFGFISTCISIILLFGISVSIPVILKLSGKFTLGENQTVNNDFETFCRQYEISKREAEIILEIYSGKTNKAISEKLFITLQTVKDHNHRIFTKTGVKSRVQLANLIREKTGIQ
jgi:DNA-binding CsgD family transcriptional regulator